MAGGFYKRLLCEFVLQVGEGGFDAGVVDQILVALLVAGEVVGLRTRTIYSHRVACCLVDERGPENEDIKCGQRRHGEDTEWKQPPFVEIRADMPPLLATKHTTK